MRIAIVGSGIAGLSAAYLLAERHDVTLYEASGRLGGHTNTVGVQLGPQLYRVDTGFIVYNERTYPNFTRLLSELRVATQPSDMSFSVCSERNGWEYCGSTFAGLFAQRRNLLRPAFHRMLREVLRFNRTALRRLDSLDSLDQTLGEFISSEAFGREFIENYLLPMGAAIWSAPPGKILDFPARSFLRFFAHHGLLSLTDRPQWRTVRGGAREYIEAMLLARPMRVRLNRAVRRLVRGNASVMVETEFGPPEQFEHVVVAAHADQALAMLANPSVAEREVLGSFSYQPNQAILHTDSSVMPQRRRAWASWNYRVPAGEASESRVTYWMNRLQRLAAPENIFVTLNDNEGIAPGKVLRRIAYRHPVFSTTAIRAQRRQAEISRERIHFCGAYWGNGFHEDGVNSALAAVRSIELSLKSSCTPVFTRGTSAIAATRP